MANTLVYIPDGEFCCDEGHLDCLFAQHTSGAHYCVLYDRLLGELEEFISNGEKRRARRKCNKCIESMINEGKLGIKVDMPS